MKAISMLEDDQRGIAGEDFSEEFLNKASAWIQKWGWGFTFIMVVVWPLLSLPAGVFTKDYFAFWIFISLAWGFTASLVIITLPIYESMENIKGVIFAMLGMTPAKSAESVPVPKKSMETAVECTEVDAPGSPRSTIFGASGE